MLRGTAFAAAMWLIVLQSSIAQTVSRAYAGDDAKVHVVYANGAARRIPSEQQQVGCERVSIAPDRRTVGWSVLVENCCTSYPVATAIVAYKDGNKAVIYPGQMIFEWRFIGRGDRISVLSGPVHGYAAQASLYNAHSGKRVASWDGRGAVPRWAKDWKEQFQR
jgi:hypothetical protein